MRGDEVEQLIQKAKSPDQTSLVIVDAEIEALPPEICELTHLTRLSISGNRLHTLPPELSRLVNLQHLILARNQFTELPEVVCDLPNLARLHLGTNRLIVLPSAIGRLQRLRRLLLSNNCITSLPAEIGQLRRLASLQLSNNHLDSLPPQISELAHLRELSANNNNLERLPDGIGDLSRLVSLRVEANRLATLPKTIGNLSRLSTLLLNQNLLEELPDEIGGLTRLRDLSVGANRLKAVPPSIGRLKRLVSFAAPKNNLTAIPRAIGSCPQLKVLDVRKNQIAVIPPEIQGCRALQCLYLRDNAVRSLPQELGTLPSLADIDVSGNSSLSSPPSEIAVQGTAAIIEYLKAQSASSDRQWISKLLLVGEGGVGKSCLIRALRHQPFEHRQSTTHGIETGTLFRQHPSAKGVSIRLNYWDFGGQEIYHATHQFFLTDRSLFLLVWNARLGFEQARLYYWLDTIRALAPTSPVIVVATHSDLRPADLPRSALKEQYPQISGFISVSNLSGDGIEELWSRILANAIDLPLMGESWPTTWLACAEAIRKIDRKYISPRELREIMEAHGVRSTSQQVLARWLHELGDILYFGDNPDLNDIVILKPEWVSSYVSKVLDSSTVRSNAGIFTRSHMEELWRDLDRGMHEHFLRLLEQFDLSYRTLEDREISIVVELLNLEPPNYRDAWETARLANNCREISMKYRFLSSVPAGIPTWFIARSHRFTTHTQWRHGALLADGANRKHTALIEYLPHDRIVRMSVRGPAPQNFFAILRDGFELTLGRFPGLAVERLVPCPGHQGKPCSHHFDLLHLEKRIERNPPILEIECPEGLESVSITGLLFGLHWRTQDEVLASIDRMKTDLEFIGQQQQAELLGAIQQTRELLQREFTNSFRREQVDVDAQCPNVFVLRPDPSDALLVTLGGQWGRTLSAEVVGSVLKTGIELHLMCQAPGSWHLTSEGGRYQIKRPLKWVRTLSPYLKKLTSVLRATAPAIAIKQGPHGAAAVKSGVEFLQALVDALGSSPEWLDDRIVEGDTFDGPGVSASGPTLRALRHLLTELDPEERWGDLRKVLTKEGHVLWLCQDHAREYSNADDVSTIVH